eukprot:TRINITY_DN34273_c0_g1_i1.p1 TRINITY_DN34273_c0_g1~~TRINITY_DN34273_c0_g1_i1.p1  ORF type:complete len:245 (-),score=52.92 TRINITY_DN34273_c0_g1_i1:121-831(-)
MDDYRAEAKRRYEQQKASQAQAPKSSEKAASSTQPAGKSPDSLHVAQAELWARWESLDAETKQQILVLGALAAVLMAAGVNVVSVILSVTIALYLRSHLPTQGSFATFFRTWFTDEYFPKISQQLQQEMQERAKKEQNLFDSLASQFKGWVMGKTESLQAGFWCELAVQRALPATFTDWFVMRTATINMGSQESPVVVVFWGFHDRWMLSPLIHMEFKDTSLIDDAQRKQVATSSR